MSRDSDFGATYKNEPYLNDWLTQEFKQRVSQKRKILLTNSLSEGLKVVHAKITKEMEEEEKNSLKELMANLERLFEKRDD